MSSVGAVVLSLNYCWMTGGITGGTSCIKDKTSDNIIPRSSLQFSSALRLLHSGSFEDNGALKVGRQTRDRQPASATPESLLFSSHRNRSYLCYQTDITAPWWSNHWVCEYERRDFCHPSVCQSVCLHENLSVSHCSFQLLTSRIGLFSLFSIKASERRLEELRYTNSYLPHWYEPKLLTYLYTKICLSTSQAATGWKLNQRSELLTTKS